MLAIYKPAKSAFNLETFPALIISACVSALCVIGIESIPGDSFKIILLPYVAMGISILLIMLLIPICKLFKKKEKTFNTHRIKHLHEKKNDKLKDND
jgi:Na+/H+-dicarboxylate symporter